MTNEEAISTIEIAKAECEWNAPLDYQIAFDMAIEALEKQSKWIPVSERLPENNEAVNITYVNHDPESYYSSVKDKPFTATGVYFSGSWYWWSSTVQDYLDEYGRFEPCKIDEAVEILAWMPLPEPYHTESEETTNE